MCLTSVRCVNRGHKTKTNTGGTLGWNLALQPGRYLVTATVSLLSASHVSVLSVEKTVDCWGVPQNPPSPSGDWSLHVSTDVIRYEFKNTC